MTELKKEVTVHEVQVMNPAGNAGNESAIPLTKKNAYRVKCIKRAGTDEEPVLFHFRKKRIGLNNYTHMYGDEGELEELHPGDFNNWEAVTFRYPGHLEEFLEKAENAYRWSSFDPDVRGETDIMHYERVLQEDMQQIPEEKQDEYISAYKQKFSSLLSSLSNCASTMITGPANFNHKRNEKAHISYDNRYKEFHEWRNRFINAMKRMKETARPEEEKQDEAWQVLKREIGRSADIIHEIDTGKSKGYNRALFVSSILNKVGTFANHGNVEIVEKAVDFINDYNSKIKKPVITARNNFFDLSNVAQRMKEKLQAVREQENKEMTFEDGTLVWNYEEDRLQILFNDIPEESKRKELKSSGFRWSPRNKAWQRQLTSNAVYAAKRVLNLQNT